MQLEALFKQPQALPAIPKIVHELIDSFNNQDVSIDDIAKKLAADPVLSARLLRLANSAYYHVSRSIGTVEDAVLMLGFGDEGVGHDDQEGRHYVRLVRTGP